MRKVFVDANIVLDFLDSLRPLHDKSVILFNKLIENDHQLVITEDLLTVIYYIVKDKKKVLLFLSTILKQWYIIPFGKEVISEAVAICIKDIRLDFEDVLQSLSAKNSGCSLIITNDKNFYNCGIDVITTDEFLKSLN